MSPFFKDVIVQPCSIGWLHIQDFIWQHKFDLEAHLKKVKEKGDRELGGMGVHLGRMRWRNKGE